MGVLFHSFCATDLNFGTNEIINFNNSDFCKLLRLCAISALQISKKHFATFDFFCKNEAWTNCGTLNSTTLIWLGSQTFKQSCDQLWHIKLHNPNLVRKPNIQAEL